MRKHFKTECTKSIAQSPPSIDVAELYERRNPVIGITRREQSTPQNRVKYTQSSPSVIPWRVAMGWAPTKDASPGATRPPSTMSHPKGLGRSSTQTGIPAAPAALITYDTVAA